MKRALATALDSWLASSRRQPLLLRGARQVGKTWLVRDLARRSGLRLVELNFEREPRLARHFDSNDPQQILGELSLALNVDILPTQCLLFLDEIQAASQLLAKLRWFAEELPALPVIAAGSLLEFTLTEHTFSMPVGRIAFEQVEPMSFPEFLDAHGQDRLLAVLKSWRLGQPFSAAAHEQAELWFHRYTMVGGLPAVVAEDVAQGDPRACRALQRDLVASYRADFAHYAGKMDVKILDSVLLAVARSIGTKFVYSRIGEGVKQHQAKNALELLARARLCTLVRHTAANGLPLGGEAKDKFRKALLLDVGLLNALIGMPAAQSFPALHDLSPTIRAQLADQMVGQQLRLLDHVEHNGPELYYWQREGGRPGEIDYVLQIGGRVLPVELKSGASGAMKSLHQFMHDKKLDCAIRLDTNPPSEQQLKVKTTQGDAVSYRLIGLPLYMAWAIARVAS